MKMTELFIGELERESISTRKLLERVPEGKYDWKPHETSMSLGYLANLVASPGGLKDVVRDCYAWNPPATGGGA